MSRTFYSLNFFTDLQKKKVLMCTFFFQDDIEQIVAQIELEEKKRQEVVEIIVPPPSKRVNFTLTAHPDKEELILLGGEYFNGQKVHYCDLGNSSALISWADQFRVYAHWSS